MKKKFRYLNLLRVSIKVNTINCLKKRIRLYGIRKVKIKMVMLLSLISIALTLGIGILAFT